MNGVAVAIVIRCRQLTGKCFSCWRIVTVRQLVDSRLKSGQLSQLSVVCVCVCVTEAAAAAAAACSDSSSGGGGWL